MFYGGVLSQTPEIKSPLTLAQIKAQVKNVEKSAFRRDQDETTARQIETRGLDFQVTDDILTDLKKLNAGIKTLNVLKLLQSKNILSPQDKVRVLIANFGDMKTQNDAITDLLLEELKQATKNYPNVEILALNERVSSTQGKEFALSKGKEKKANIVVWGWYKKSETHVLVNVHFEIISAIPDIPRINTRKQIVEENPKFESFALQVRLSKEISFLTLVSLGLINLELEEGEMAEEFFTQALASIDRSDDPVAMSEVYLYRALAKSQICNSVSPSEIREDIDKAISLGLSSNDPRVYAFLQSDRLIDDVSIAENNYKIAKTDKEKITALFVLGIVNAKNDKEDRAKAYAQEIIDFVSPLKESANNYLYLAVAYLILEDNKKFNDNLEKALKLAGNNRGLLARIYGLRATLYYDEEKYDLVIDNLRKKIELRSNCYNDHMELGDAYRDTDQLDKAIESYSKAAEINPVAAWIYSRRGGIYERKSDREKALKDYQKAIDLDPSDSGAHCDLGYFFEGINESEKALAAITKCISLRDNNAYPYSFRASIYQKKGADKLSLEDYQKALQLGLQDRSENGKSLMRNMLASSKCSVEPVKGYCALLVNYTDKYIDAYPNEGWGYANRSMIRTRKQDIWRAIEDINKAITLRPDAAIYYELRGDSYWAAKDKDKAVADYLKASDLQLLDRSAEGKKYFQDLLYKISGIDPARAIGPIGAYLGIYPNDTWGYALRGVCYLKTIDPSVLARRVPLVNRAQARLLDKDPPGNAFFLAKTDCERAYKLLSADRTPNGKIRLQEFLDKVLNSASRYPLTRENAILLELPLRFINYYVRLYPKDAWGHYQKYLTLLKKENIDLAITAIGEATRMEPNNPFYYFLRGKTFLARFRKYETELLIGRAKIGESGILRPLPQINTRDYDFAIAAFDRAFNLRSNAPSDEGKKMLKGLTEDITLLLSSTTTAPERRYKPLDYFDMYIQLYPDDGWSFSEKAIYLWNYYRDLQSSLKNIDKALLLEPQNDSYYRLRAVLWLKKDNSDEILDRSMIDINHAININPDEYRYYLTRSEIFEKKKNMKEAVKNMVEVIKIFNSRHGPDFSAKEVDLLVQYKKRLEDLKKESEKVDPI